MTIYDVFANFIQILGNTGYEILRCWMLALDLPENLDWRLARIDFLGGVGERFLFGF